MFFSPEHYGVGALRAICSSHFKFKFVLELVSLVQIVDFIWSNLVGLICVWIDRVGFSSSS